MVETTGPLTSNQQIHDKIVELQEAIEQKVPSYKSILQTIHAQLKADPDLTHLLSDEEVGVIIAGLSQHKGIVINAATAKGIASGRAGKKVVGVDDI